MRWEKPQNCLSQAQEVGCRILSGEECHRVRDRRSQADPRVIPREKGAECHPALGCSHCSRGHLGTTELWRGRNLGAGLQPAADSLPPAFKVGLPPTLHWKQGLGNWRTLATPAGRSVNSWWEDRWEGKVHVPRFTW